MEIGNRTKEKQPIENKRETKTNGEIVVIFFFIPNLFQWISFWKINLLDIKVVVCNTDAERNAQNWWSTTKAATASILVVGIKAALKYDKSVQKSHVLHIDCCIILAWAYTNPQKVKSIKEKWLPSKKKKTATFIHSGCLRRGMHITMMQSSLVTKRSVSTTHKTQLDAVSKHPFDH